MRYKDHVDEKEVCHNLGQWRIGHTFESVLFFFFVAARCLKTTFQRTRMIILTWSRKFLDYYLSFSLFPLVFEITKFLSVL